MTLALTSPTTSAPPTGFLDAASARRRGRQLPHAPGHRDERQQRERDRDAGSHRLHEPPRIVRALLQRRGELFDLHGADDVGRLPDAEGRERLEERRGLPAAALRGRWSERFDGEPAGGDPRAAVGIAGSRLVPLDARPRRSRRTVLLPASTDEPGRPRDR